MASLVSISISTTLLCSTKTLSQSLLLYGIGTRRVAGPGGRQIIIPLTSGKAITHLLSNHSDGGMSRSWHYCSIDALTRRSCNEPLLCHVGVSCSPYNVISGYWIGPEVEDGWGFIEAYVHRIS